MQSDLIGIPITAAKVPGAILRPRRLPALAAVFSHSILNDELFCDRAIKTFSDPEKIGTGAKGYFAYRVFAALRQSF